jgi:type II secretory pathway pseudopilin PulG
LSLIELLVVIAIIGVLLALSAAAFQKTKDGANYSRTSEQVYKLQTSLNSEIARINSTVPTNTQDLPPWVYQYCDNDPQRTRSICMALEQRRHFPTTFVEANTPAYIVQTASGGLGLRIAPANPVATGETIVYTYKSLAHFTEVNTLTGTGSPNEDGALLYIIMSKASATGGGAMAQAADDISTAQRIYVTFSGTQKYSFADGFRRAVGFIRWDSRSEVQAAPYIDPKATYLDPLDPTNKIGSWSNATKKAEVQSLLQFGGQNRVPNVYSYGQDGVPSSDDVLGFRVIQPGNKGY